MPIRNAVKAVERLLEHAAAIAAGLVLVVFGLAMTFSIVFAIPGILVLVIGIAVVVGGIFAHPARRARRIRG
jgi:uncharacterized membrane protein HdeD (DUF308 family)